jgi:hypothetical protein|tara:strand:+ start:465 stop:647 length:183 start_codon:yes stop_codon:yes gene_type:complete
MKKQNYYEEYDDTRDIGSRSTKKNQKKSKRHNEKQSLNNLKHLSEDDIEDKWDSKFQEEW